jgi:two-component system phosphate regulon sensor histidine kinase PhoR
MVTSVDPPGSKQRMPLTLWALILLLAMSLGTGMAAYLLPGNEMLVLGASAFLGVLAAVPIHRLLLREAKQFGRAARALPDWDAAAAQSGWAAEFQQDAESIRASSERISRQLSSLHEERQHLEALLDSMQDAVVAVDGAGRIQWSNRAMQALVPHVYSRGGVRLGQALAHTVRDPEVLDCVKWALERRTHCEKTTSLGPGRIFEVNATPVPGGGAVAVLHDITRVEQVERTQRDFVANVSHELRTPLTSISGYVETLIDSEPLSPMAREFLETILKNATRMSRLTDDLLTMARVESREAKMHPVAVRADLLVKDAVASMRGLVQDEEATLEVGETTPVEVYADVDAMLQVLGNLIENGIKYGRPGAGQGSRVIVSARALDGPVGRVEFSVRDFGRGIPSEHLERIFERFYRVDKARSRESGGTGLGLAIARHMVEAQGGTIRAESELNAGSQFLVTLPSVVPAS